MYGSRERKLEETLSTLGWTKALDALDLVRGVMRSENGYKRHNGSHYYYHLVDAAQKLINYGIRDEDIITGCLLHDLPEDVKEYTIKFIEIRFGKRVATMVFLVTKKEDVDYKVSENMETYLSEIEPDVGACLIKTVDRLHNFSTLKDATPEKKMRQAIETENHFIPFFKRCRNLYPRYAYIFFDAKTTIEPQLWEIKERYEQEKAYKEEIESLKQQIERLNTEVLKLKEQAV